MKKWYQKSMAVLTAAACLFAGGTIGLARDSLPQLQLTAEAEESTYIEAAYGLQLKYDYLSDGTVEITKFVSSSSTDIELPSVIDGKSVTSIGDSAFNANDIEACSNLTSIVIPDSVTSIGDDAFYNCTSLTDVTIPNSVTSIGDDAFYSCTSLTDVTIPDSVTSIEGSMFYHCTSLTSVMIPDSVTSIGDGIFSGCTSLTEIIVDSNNKVYTSKDGILFDKNFETIICYPGGKAGNFTIPDSVTSIGYGAFDCCKKLTSIIIPGSVTSIGTYAFYSCTSLTDVTIPDSVTSIGSYAFLSCKNLTDITISDSVTSIGEYAFDRCTSLTDVTIPDSVTSIGVGTFRGCTSLTEIIVDSNNKSYTSRDGILFNKSLETIICYPGGKARNFTIPDSVTSIGDFAFYSCTSLTDVTIPDSVTSIGWYAFYYCDNLTDIYYKGTESQWSEISIGSSAIPSNAIIHYESEPVTTTTTTTMTTTTTTTKPTTTTTTTKPTTTTTVTTTTTAAYTFTPGADNWSFLNSYSNFKHPNYFILDSYYDKLMDGLTNVEKNRVNELLELPWGGSCYGMAATSIWQQMIF